MLRKLTSVTKRQLLPLGISIFLISSGLESCVIFNYNQTPDYTVDIVCGKKTDKSEAYESSFKGNKYYFDSYNCKQIFKQNPQKFIDNRCAEIK